MKKRFITKGASAKRVLFLIQTVLMSPVLLPLLVLNVISDMTLDGWGEYRRWFVGSARGGKKASK
jgi:hypothetical protein